MARQDASKKGAKGKGKPGENADTNGSGSGSGSRAAAAAAADESKGEEHEVTSPTEATTSSNGKTDASPSGSGVPTPLLVFGAVLAVLAALAFKWKDLMDEAVQLPPIVGLDRELDNTVDVCFTIHPNGEGKEPGARLCSRDFADVDDVLSKHCPSVMNVEPERCAPNSGARLITGTGVRVLSFADILPNDRVYVVPQGVHFVWPSVKIGNVVYPRNVQSPTSKPIIMRELSSRPRVFAVGEFCAPRGNGGYPRKEHGQAHAQRGGLCRLARRHAHQQHELGLSLQERQGAAGARV